MKILGPVLMIRASCVWLCLIFAVDISEWMRVKNGQYFWSSIAVIEMIVFIMWYKLAN